MTVRSEGSLVSKGSYVSGAYFSQCGLYRYLLWRRWAHGSKVRQAMIIGLNPSMADEFQNDPTIRRCIQFAKDWGYGGLVMANVFAYRATRPVDLFAAKDPIGCKNDRLIQDVLKDCDVVIAAWGNHCPTERQNAIAAMIEEPLYCLGCNQNGSPKHPLYLPKTTKLRPYSCNG